nr:thermonuclease family protein [uncultured Desulfuromonas sp.]
MKKFTGIVVVSTVLFLPVLSLAAAVIIIEKIDPQHTLTVLVDNFHRKQVRLYGIDIPDEDQPYGIAATRRLKRLARQPFQIQTIRQDEQGRTVALLITSTGRSINEQMVAQGYAWVDNKQYREELCSGWLDAQIKAKHEKIGLWSQPNPQPPWQWRKRQH